LARWLGVGFVALALIAGVVLAAMYIFGASNVSYAHRYRLGIAIEIDGQVYSGSSVIEVGWVGSRLPDMGKFIPVVTGQAVYVDLGKHGAVIATLYPGYSADPSPDGARSVVRLASLSFGNQTSYAELPELPKFRGRRYLPPEHALKKDSSVAPAETVNAVGIVRHMAGRRPRRIQTQSTDVKSHLFSEASSIIQRTSSSKEMPAWAASSGTSEVSVMPGMVLTSRHASPATPRVSS
jgi:hypothetical protein